MYSLSIHTVMSIEDLIFSMLPIPFCLLTLFVLVYYERRRYKLYLEIKRVPQELLIMESYKNHLKNLKLKCVINNFIIVILVLEFVQNMGEVIYVLLYWSISFGGKIKVCELLNNLFPFIKTAQYVSSLGFFPIRFTVVLCLLMNFLWLAYQKYEYRYTIIRWTVYILIRTLVIFLINIPRNYNYDIFQDGYIIQILLLSLLVERFFLVLDLIQFVFYSRKFYLHLKSREKEIKLFYFDERAYLESKYLLIHFKIATILVGIALFFFTIGGFIITPLPDTLAIYLQVPFTNLGYIIFLIY